MTLRSRITTLALSATLAAVSPLAAQTTVIKARTVIDGKGGTLNNVAIVIQGSKIVRIEPAGADATYDLTAETVMPGLIDTHTHIVDHFDRATGRLHTSADPETPAQTTLYTLENAYKTFMAGFTTIQSPGAEVDKDVRDWINDGRVPGPRILTSLRQIFDTTGTPDQIRAFVRKAVADGADFIKIFATGSIREGGKPTMTDAQIQAACGEGNALGKRTIAHAQGPEGAKAAVLAGCTSIEHGNRLTDEVIRLMAEHGTYFDSNNHLMIHNYLENKSHFLGIGNYTEEGFAYMERGLASGNDSFRRALAAKVKMVFGTDATAGAHGRNAEELIYRVKDGGQAPMDAIVTATSRSAESLRLGNQIGTIAPGMEADIIATDGNPLQDITAVRRVTFVMKGGKVFRNEVPASASKATTAILAGTVSAQSKDDPALGTWKLNVAKSTFTPGPPIKGDTRSYEVNNDGWLIVTTETIQPDGARTGVRFAARFDGKPYPQIGRFAPTVTLITYEPVDKRTLKYTQRDNTGKVVSTNTRTVSADGKTMTIEQKTTDDKGRPVVNVELFERQ